MTFLISPQSPVTCNQYCGKPADKTTICNVPWPPFCWATCPWPCSAWSMGKCGCAILSSELGATAALGRDWDPAAAASHEGHAIPPMRGKTTCFFTPAGCSVKQNLRDPNGHRKKALHPWYWGQSCGTVLLLLRAGSTPVKPEAAQGLVPDTSSRNGHVTQLNKMNSQYWLSCRQGWLSPVEQRGPFPPKLYKPHENLFLFISLNSYMQLQ